MRVKGGPFPLRFSSTYFSFCAAFIGAYPTGQHTAGSTSYRSVSGHQRRPGLQLFSELHELPTHACQLAVRVLGVRRWYNS